MFCETCLLHFPQHDSWCTCFQVFDGRVVRKRQHESWRPRVRTAWSGRPSRLLNTGRADRWRIQVHLFYDSCHDRHGSVVKAMDSLTGGLIVGVRKGVQNCFSCCRKCPTVEVDRSSQSEWKILTTLPPEDWRRPQGCPTSHGWAPSLFLLLHLLKSCSTNARLRQYTI